MHGGVGYSDAFLGREFFGESDGCAFHFVGYTAFVEIGPGEFCGWGRWRTQSEGQYEMDFPYHFFFDGCYLFSFGRGG